MSNSCQNSSRREFSWDLCIKVIGLIVTIILGMPDVLTFLKGESQSPPTIQIENKTESNALPKAHIKGSIPVRQNL
jgi:hypothetical protein